MQGIPVRQNGDPVSHTYVLAGSYLQFTNWCMYSRVNPRSRMVRYIDDDRCLRGGNHIDLVYTGTHYDHRAIRHIREVIRYLRAVGAIDKTYDQDESCEIEPNVVD